MFTGIVEELGRVVAVEVREGATRLEVASAHMLEGTRTGDSIAINGVCLTVVALTDATFAVEAVPETLRCSNLGNLAVDSAVNLERALAPDRFMGGHYVQGHVDGTGRVISIDDDGEAQNFRFEAPRELMRFIVPKGFVCVDGASLTAVEVADESFTVTLIPHTQEAVVMGTAGVGYEVNLEVDVMAKFAERIVGARLDDLEARLAALEAKG